MIRQIALNPSLSGSTYDILLPARQPDLKITTMDLDSTRRLGGQMDVPWSQPNGHSFGSTNMDETARDFWNPRGARSSNASSSHGRSSQDPSPPPLSSPSVPPELPTPSSGVVHPNFTWLQPTDLWNGGDVRNGMGLSSRTQFGQDRASYNAYRNQMHREALALAEARLSVQQNPQQADAQAQAPWQESLFHDEMARMERRGEDRATQWRSNRTPAMTQPFHMPAPLFAQNVRQAPSAPSVSSASLQDALPVAAIEAMQSLNLSGHLSYPGLHPWSGPIQQTQESQEPSDPVLRDFLRTPAKEAKKWELRDIYDHVVAFSGDTGGSRFIQTKLETANSDEKARVFQEIFPNAIQLMKDVYGNYVIQKFFEHGNQEQKRRLASVMQGKVADLSQGMYSCRVVQKALECVLVQQQADLARELSQGSLRLMKDSNANHVIQKAIECVPREHLDFIMDVFRSNFSVLSKNKYGCRVVQRMLEYGTDTDKSEMVPWIIADAENLALEDYGNYVLQHIIEHGKPEDRASVIRLVVQKTIAWSKLKRASNVVERSIQHASPEEKSQILEQVLRPSKDGSDTLAMLIKDSYGNYVIATLVLNLKDKKQQLEFVKKHVKPILDELTRQDSRRHRGGPNSLDKLRAAVDQVLASSGAGDSIEE